MYESGSALQELYHNKQTSNRCCLQKMEGDMTNNLVKSQWDACEEMMDKYSKTESGSRYTQAIADMQDKLKESLTTEQWDLFLKVEALMVESEGDHVFWMYRSGVTDGMQLQQEIDAICKGGRE